MNKYKKRIIEQWKTYGFFTMNSLKLYKEGSGSSPLHYTGDLESASYWYVKYMDTYVLLNEHNI